jgi:hypothetical protein
LQKIKNNITMKIKLPAFCLCVFLTTNSIGQQTVIDSALTDRVDALEKQVSNVKPGEDHVMIVGLATVGFASNKTTTTFEGVKQVTKTNSFPDGDHYEFSPMFLWRHGNKFLMEFEPSFADDQLGVNWAEVSYFATPGVILRAGLLVIPFGFYPKHLAAGWITKLASDPFGVADLPPTTDYGVEVEGGLQAGTMKWNYDVSLTNGMQLLGDGTVQTPGITDNNRNKMLTGRIGWLPFSNSSLELGVSGLTGKVGDAGSDMENVKANMYAFDLNMVENIKPFQLNIKGQYNIIDIGRANYINPVDSSTYSFTNHTTTGFIQASLRPSFSDNKVFKNFEVAARYGTFTTPTNSIFGSKQNGWAAGLDYWLSWRTVVKFTYEALKTTSNSNINPDIPHGFLSQSNSMYLQFAIQL